MDVLLKRTDTSILKAATVLDLILEKLNKKDLERLQMDKRELKSILTVAANQLNTKQKEEGDWGRVDETPKDKPDWSDFRDLREGEEEDYDDLTVDELFGEEGELKSFDFILKNEGAMILWTQKRVNENRPFKSPQTRVEPSFMQAALLQLRGQLRQAHHPELVDMLVKMILDKDATTHRDISPEQDPYTKTGKKGGAEIRHIKPQEHVLIELLEKIENKENYKDNIRLKNRLIEEKVLTMNFLARVSSDLSDGTSYVHPRIISKLENDAIKSEFIQFLHSMGRGWPTRENISTARNTLAQRGQSTQLVDILTEKPKKFIFQENLYERQMDRLHGWLEKSMDEWDEFLDDFNDGEEITWADIENQIQEEYNAESESKKKNVSYEEYEGKHLVKIVMRALQIIKDIERIQTAKVRLEVIVKDNGFSITLDNSRFDDIQNSYTDFKKTYNYNKYVDEASRKLEAKKDGVPHKKPAFKEAQQMLEGRLSPQFSEEPPLKHGKGSDPHMLIQMHNRMKAMIPQLEAEINEAEEAGLPTVASRQKLKQISKDLEDMEEKFSKELNLEEEE